MDLENESIKDDALIEAEDIVSDDVAEEEVEAEEVEGEESFAGAISSNSEEEEIAAYMYQQEDWTM